METLSKKLDLRLNIESGISDALNLFMFRGKSFEIEFANMERKVMKSWMESDMVVPAKRHWNYLSLNTTVKNEEVYFVVALNLNMVDFGDLKSNLEDFGGMPINLQLDAHNIEIFENKFNCESNLLDP